MIRDDGENRGNVRAMAVFAALGLGAAGLGAGSALAGSAVSETVLYSCCQQTNCTDGQLPLGGLIATTQGALYGTTVYGGRKADAGVAFLVTVTGGHSLVHSFQGTSMEGETAPLFRDKSGNLFGTTFCLDGKAPEASWLRLAPAISTGQQRKAEQ